MASPKSIAEQQARIRDSKTKEIVTSYKKLVKRFEVQYRDFLTSSPSAGNKVDIALAARTIERLEEMLADAGLGDLIQTYANSYRAITEAALLDFTDPDITLAKKLQGLDLDSVEALIDFQANRLGNIVRTEFVSTISESVLYGALGNIDKESVIQQLALLDVGLSEKQIRTEVVSAYRNYQQEVRIAKASSQGLEFARYGGPLDSLTRDFCQDVLAGSSPGLAPGWYTAEEAQELARDPARAFNCRHNFFYSNNPEKA